MRLHRQQQTRPQGRRPPRKTARSERSRAGGRQQHGAPQRRQIGRSGAEAGDPQLRDHLLEMRHGGFRRGVGAAERGGGLAGEIGAEAYAAAEAKLKGILRQLAAPLPHRRLPSHASR